MNFKSLFLVAALSLFAFSACNKDEKNNAPEFLNITYTSRADDVLISNTTFAPYEPYEASGDVMVYKNSFHHVLRFENFLIDNGPNLKVYLSASSENVDDTIYIGDLRAASGNFNYTFSVNADIFTYRYVLVRSEDQNAIYCWAQLL